MINATIEETKSGMKSCWISGYDDEGLRVMSGAFLETTAQCFNWFIEHGVNINDVKLIKNCLYKNEVRS